MTTQITLRNMHTADEMTVELLSTEKTWQNVYTVRYEGKTYTLTNAQGWTVKKESE
jgi:hypothetical protein